MVPLKGVKELLLAMQKLPRRAVLVAVGSTNFGLSTKESYERELYMLAQQSGSRVVFTGFVHNTELWRYYALADAACMPTIGQEAAGLVAVEAMASGRPVVATCSGGIPEYIPAEAGLLVPVTPNLPEDLANAPAPLMEDPARCRAMGLAGERAALAYSPQQYYQNFVSILDGLTERERKGVSKVGKFTHSKLGAGHCDRRDSKLSAIFIAFFSQWVFIHYLGMEYVSVDGLFSSVLTFLSLAELGVGSAITVYLYKPLAEKDTRAIQSYMHFYKKCYRIIGWVILLLGLCLVPVLNRLVNFDNAPPINLYLVYLLFLVQFGEQLLVLFAYKSSIISADQKGYLINNLNTVFTVAASLGKCAVVL